MQAAIVDFLLGLALASTGSEASNRFSVEGLAFEPGSGGALAVRARRLEAASARISAGALTLEVGQAVLHDVAAQLRFAAGAPALAGLQAASAELSGVKLHGPLVLPAHAQAAAPEPCWRLDPLATADGAVRAKIVDAHLLFDADVTVPIRHGRIDFKDATVEHVGPDSRMGVSRMGLYVDAPNGRSYLYQFPSGLVPGVQYEKRGAMLGPWVTDRGNLALQPFGEWLLHQSWASQLLGVTEQARLLFDRTAASGELRLGDGLFAAPGVQAELAGRAEGRNQARLQSEAVGRGLTLEMPSVSAQAARLSGAGMQLDAAKLDAGVVLRVFLENRTLRFAFELANAKVTGLRLTSTNG